MKIEVQFIRYTDSKGGGFNTKKMSEENFYHFLYQPELFKFGEV
jgi:hypothetical protein